MISKALSEWYINHDEIGSVKNILKEYNEMKEELETLDTNATSSIWIYYIKMMETYCKTCEKNTANKDSSIKKTRKSRLMLASNCVICGKKKWKLVKYQEVSKLELH